MEHDPHKPRTGAECRFHFKDDSCSEYRDVTCKATSRACARGLKPETTTPPQSALFDEGPKG